MSNSGKTQREALAGFGLSPEGKNLDRKPIKKYRGAVSRLERTGSLFEKTRPLRPKSTGHKKYRCPDCRTLLNFINGVAGGSKYARCPECNHVFSNGTVQIDYTVLAEQVTKEFARDKDIQRVIAEFDISYFVILELLVGIHASQKIP